MFVHLNICTFTSADNPEWLDLFKRAHAPDYIPTEVSGIGMNIPEDLEIYTDLGIRIPFSVQVARGMSIDTITSATAKARSMSTGSNLSDY